MQGHESYNLLSNISAKTTAATTTSNNNNNNKQMWKYVNWSMQMKCLCFFSSATGHTMWLPNHVTGQGLLH